MVVVHIVVALLKHLDEEAVVGISRNDKCLVGFLMRLHTHKVRKGVIRRKVKSRRWLISLMTTSATKPLKHRGIDRPKRRDVKCADIEDNSLTWVLTLRNVIRVYRSDSLTKHIGYGNLYARGGSGDTREGECVDCQGVTIVRKALLYERVEALIVVGGKNKRV